MIPHLRILASSVLAAAVVVPATAQEYSDPRGFRLKRTPTDPRDAAEVESWKGRDPIALLTGQLREQGELDDAGLRAIESEIAGAIEAAVAFAEASPFPLPEHATDDVFAA